MSNTRKYIGINQRIPFEVIDVSIQYFIENDNIDKNYILQRMLEHTKGINRANKAANYIFQILKRQEQILLLFKKSILNVPYYSLKIYERKTLCLNLVCLTFPITYDLLIALAHGFKVQEQINKKFISEKVMSIYGSNRTVDIAIDALLPMIIELNAIKRDKISIYSKAEKLLITNKFLLELLIYTDIKLSGSKSILFDDLIVRPWYSYFEYRDEPLDEFKFLINKKEGSVGRGYLTI